MEANMQDGQDCCPLLNTKITTKDKKDKKKLYIKYGGIEITNNFYLVGGENMEESTVG